MSGSRSSRRELRRAARAALVGSAVSVVLANCSAEPRATEPREMQALEAKSPETPMNPALLAAGRQIFRYDTFGDETYWTDTLRMHEVIRTSVSPATALAVGLKVDLGALPEALREAIAAGEVDLTSPATTVALLKLGAVVGLRGEVDEEGTLVRVGVTCALCHSTVDDAFAPGIGNRLDGWPNRTLDVGAIVALSPAVPPALKTILTGWGAGMYDPRINIDGQNVPVVIPPAFGLRHVAKETYTADGPVAYWNAYVAITQMHGHGTFRDPRLDIDVTNPPDLVSSKLEALSAYQFSLRAPEAIPADRAAAQRGRAIFHGAAGCVKCHRGGSYTDVNSGTLHAPADVGQDPAYALRTATKRYRTTPLRGLWHPPQLQGPYFHDGSAATLEEVVEHYVALRDLALSAQQKADLVAFLKTL